MIIDVLILIVLLLINLGIRAFFKSIKENSIRCCGDCKTYEKCWKNVYDKDCYETPACENFSERYSDYNRQ